MTKISPDAGEAVKSTTWNRDKIADVPNLYKVAVPFFTVRDNDSGQSK